MTRAEVKPAPAVKRSGFGVGAIVAAIGALEIEPVWVKGVLLLAAWLGTLAVYQLAGRSYRTDDDAPAS